MSLFSFLARTVFDVLPCGLTEGLCSVYVSLRFGRAKKALLKEIQASDDSELAEMLPLIKDGPPSIFYGGWKKSYSSSALRREVTRSEDGFPRIAYTCVGGSKKELYFPKSFSLNYAAAYIKGLLQEQDAQSPHCYLTEGLLSRYGYRFRTVLDLGAAEGNFSLSVVDNASKIYMFERDGQMIEALEKTFAPYWQKVRIVRKFVSDYTDEVFTSLDDYFSGDMPTDVDLIKMDIEGAEQASVRGMKKLLECNPCATVLVCAYHSKEAEREIRALLPEYEITARRGYMVLWWGTSIFSSEKARGLEYFRHGVLEVKRKAER